MVDIDPETQTVMRDMNGLVGFCAQQDFAFVQNTVYENLCFFAQLKLIPDSRIDPEIESIMKKLRLFPYMNLSASKLSGGMKRRLSIAIALLNNPQFLIFDESTAGTTINPYM